MNRKNWLAIIAALLTTGLFALAIACGGDDNGDNGSTDDDDNDDAAKDDDDADDDDNDDNDDDAGTKDTGGSTGQCPDPSTRPPTCLPKGDEKAGDVVSKLICIQKDELYQDKPCTYASCAIYEKLFQARQGCSYTTPDTDMCNCLDCFYKQIACMKWQDDYQKCDDPAEIEKICEKERDLCMSSYPEGKCEMIFDYTYAVSNGDVCYEENACAQEKSTNHPCKCEQGYWNCAADIEC